MLPTLLLWFVRAAIAIAIRTFVFSFNRIQSFLLLNVSEVLGDSRWRGRFPFADPPTLVARACECRGFHGEGVEVSRVP